MLTAERHFIILQVLKEQGNATVHELSEATGASISTIRRDLVQLEELDKLKRVHGGATQYRTKWTEPSLNEKSSQNLTEKTSIATYAASLIEDGDCIFLDAGTTTQKVAEQLRGKNLIAVTNGYQVVETLLANGITTYLIGGKLKPNTGAMIGGKALEGISTYRFDKSFIGINGIHESFGYTTADPEEAIMKKTAIDLSKESYIVADHSKIGETAFSKVAELHECTIITSHFTEPNLDKISEQTTVEVVKL
ncbi:DeoR/GlpR family DNA-binding transcription regulator [Alkalihalobacillus sp. CinArs1]|uniref:DeoR/GlpR family DNA-binding transcription regulator n=1 Tax=Alkalihalobacillus sp. CinArs1 TaxID=2995314 RepID=UPI0022DE18EF|nr:DeoR/GlpR family DNA-binding transcription regulator [Alkalihalobacillus sp. CinArs1]